MTEQLNNNEMVLNMTQGIRYMKNTQTTCLREFSLLNLGEVIWLVLPSGAEVMCFVAGDFKRVGGSPPTLAVWT